MNKCKNCGTEFEGNFCPKCGTASEAPKVCPKCNAQLIEGARYCSKCGYDLLGESSVYAKKSAPTAHTASVTKVSGTVQKLLKYLPTALFALWAVLLWAFYAAPVMKGDGFFVQNANLYQVVKDEMFVDLHPVCYALIAFAAISCAYALVLAILRFKGSERAYGIASCASFAFYVAVIVCAAVLGAKYNELVDELEDTNGSLVAVVIALSAVFAVLQAVLLVLSRKYVATERRECTPRANSQTPSKVWHWFATHKVLVIIILVVVVVGAVLGSVLPGVLGNVFRADKVDNIQLGDGYAEVESVLGAPDRSTASKYEYFSDNIASKMREYDELSRQVESVTDFSQLQKLDDQMEKLERELQTIEYKYICIDFSDGKVTSVLLDMVRTNNLSTKTKQEQSVEISEIPLNADLSYVTIYATIYYNDGSYKLSAISDITDQIDKTIFWSDGFGSYSAQLKYGEIGNGSVIEITLDPNGGTLADGTSKQQEVVYGRNFTLPVPVKENYVFEGWYNDKQQIADSNGSIKNWNFDNIKTTLVAKYSAKIYTITYRDVENANNPNPTSYTVEDENIHLKPATKPGYTVVGWYSDSLFQNQVYDISTSQAKDIELWAKWEYAQYDLTFNYDSNVGDFDGDKPTTYTIEGLPLPQLVGKNGNGHYSVEWQDDSGNVYTNEIPQGTTGDLTLTLTKWGGTHSYDNKYECTVCGQMQEPYSEVDGEVKPYTMSDGKIIFGTYPQSEVDDTALQSMLNAEIQNKRPSSDNANGWTDYGYYIGGEVQSYTWYVDVEYQGAKYRGVYFTNYRPDYTTIGSNTVFKCQTINGYNTKKVYWFKWEPITWRILSQENGKALIMADLILDSQQYYHEESGTRTIDGKTLYPNNYKESDIRKWLNSDFYNAAFDELSKDFIIQTEVDNRASTTRDDDNKYACENTFDNVFLPSYSDVLNTSYGFKDKYNTFDTARQLKTTDYALCQGLENFDVYDSRWWLRSPEDYFANETSYVEFGSISWVRVFNTDRGVVPALNITL